MHDKTPEKKFRDKQKLHHKTEEIEILWNFCSISSSIRINTKLGKILFLIIHTNGGDFE